MQPLPMTNQQQSINHMRTYATFLNQLISVTANDELPIYDMSGDSL